MKTHALLFSGSLMAMAMVIPSKVDVPFFRVYESVRVNTEKNEAYVSVSTLKRGSGRSSEQEGWKFNVAQESLSIDLAFFKQVRMIADSVLKATPGDDSKAFGTAFHLGQGYVLTNQHVLSTARSNTTQCKSFSVKTGTGTDTFPCTEVVHCNASLDYCLIRVKASKDWRGRLNRSPETVPSLRLNAETPPSDGLYATIGNPDGKGLHFSRGRGLGHRNGSFTFYAPVHSGNSGGPLLNQAGEVVGLVYAQQKYGIDEAGFNWALPIKTILNDLKKNLKEDHPATEFLRTITPN